MFPAETQRRRGEEWLVDSGENWRLDCFADCFATLAMTLLAMTAREWEGKLSHGFGAAYGVT